MASFSITLMELNICTSLTLIPEWVFQVQLALLSLLPQIPLQMQ